MPRLVQVQEDYGGPRFTVLGIADESAADLERFREEHGLDFPLLAEAKATREAFGIGLIWGCVYYLVDPGGTVVADTLDDALELLDENFTE